MITDMLGSPLIELIEFPTPRRPHAFVEKLGERIKRILLQNP